jgi:hypothetical protein
MYYDKEENSFVFVHYPDDLENRYEMWSWVLDLRPHDIIADDWDIDNWDTEEDKEEV